MGMQPIQLLLVEDNPTDALFLQDTLAAAPDVSFQATHVAEFRAASQRLAYDPTSPCPVEKLLAQADAVMYAQKYLKRG